MLLASLGVVGAALLVALATDVGLTVLTPAKFVFGLVGFALLVPTIVLKDPKAYWLFLLVLSIPFDISKWLSDPELSQTLTDTYGVPGSGTNSLEIYLSDAVLVAMLAPWLARVCLKQERIYFPKVGYFFAFYLAWALLVSLVNAQVFYFSLFELCRQGLYLLCFVYIINNVTTRRQFRSVIGALLLGFVIGSGSVIAFFERGIGSESAPFAGLHDQFAEGQSGNRAPKSGADTGGHADLTLNGNTSRHLGSKDGAQASDIKRSQGMFRHPSIPASLCGLILPIVLGYFLAARGIRSRILFLAIYAWGFVALLLTFSRAGLLGLLVGTLVFFVVAGWSGFISRRVLNLSAVAFALTMVLTIPLLLIYLETRPGAFFMRFYLFETAFEGYLEHPILGVGFANSTAAMQPGKRELKEMGMPVTPGEAADSYYLGILVELGPLGVVLLFGFYGKVILIGLRAIRDAPVDTKPLLVGMVAGVASLATQSLADEPTQGHAVSGMFWLFLALIVAIARQTRPDEGASLAAVLAPGGPPASRAVTVGATGDPA